MAVRMVVALASTLVISAVSGRAAAQVEPTTIRVASGDTASDGAIDGTVVDTSGASLALVEVAMLDAPYLRVRTNSGGGYRFDRLSAGFHLLRFRRIGLMPLTVPVTVRPSEITGVDAVLEQMPQTLANVVIQDSMGEVLRLPPGVADRVRNGTGTYITAADIERVHPINTSQMLRYVPGAEVTKDGGVNSTRGTISLLTPGCKYGLPVYIDGQKVADPHVGADTLHDRPLTDYVQPSDIAVIEVYRGPSEIPETLPQDKCGGLFIWTKR